MRATALDNPPDMLPPIGGWSILMHVASFALLAGTAGFCVYWMWLAAFLEWFFGMSFLVLLLAVPALLCTVGAVMIAWRLARRLVVSV